MTYNLNKKLIEQLKNGEIALENTHNLQLLRKILKTAFPEEKSYCNGSYIYYYKHPEIKNSWSSSDGKNLPTVPLLDFIEKEEYKFTVDYVNNHEKVAIFINSMEEENSLREMAVTGFIKGANTFLSYYTIPYTGTWSRDLVYLSKNNYEIINASDFIKNNTKTMENKEIIAYKLINLKYAVAVDNLSGYKIGTLGTIDAKAEYTIACLKEAGVLDLWFEKVYKEQEKTLTLSNGKTVKISKGKIEAEGNVVTIKSLQSLLLPPNIVGFPVQVTQGTFKIGCSYYITVDDLKLIIKEYEEINK